MSEPERARFIDNDGQRVILLDFTGIKDDPTALAAIERARQFIASQRPDGSHFTLTDVTRTIYTRQSVEAMKGFTVHNRPYVRAAAVVSDSGLHRTAIKMLAMFSGRRLSVFDTREDALAWLTTQR